MSKVTLVIASMLVLCAQARAQEPTPVEQAEEPAAVEPQASEAPAPAAEPAAASPQCASPCAPSAIDDDDSDAGWLILGIGGSIGASSIALGASLMAQGGLNQEYRLGLATLTAGVTGVAVSVLVGLIAM